MLQRDLRRGRIEQKCAPKPPPVRPHKPLQTNGGTDELANPSAAALHLGITLAAKPRYLRCLRAFNSRFSQPSSPRLPPRLRVKNNISVCAERPHRPGTFPATIHPWPGIPGSD